MNLQEKTDIGFSKKRDVNRALTEAEKTHLSIAAYETRRQREKDRKPPLECAVIESDWPEYQFVWRLIEERVLHPDVSLFRIIQKLSKFACRKCNGSGKSKNPAPDEVPFDFYPCIQCNGTGMEIKK